MYTIFHAVIGYFFLLLTVRVLTRRPGAQLTPFEFVIIFLIGGLVILATVGNDRSMTNCFGAVVTIAFIHRLVAVLKQRYPRFGLIVDGTPIMLLQNGQWERAAMQKVRIDDADVMASARTKGIRTLADIKYAVLERNGTISIIKTSK